MSDIREKSITFHKKILDKFIYQYVQKYMVEKQYDPYLMECVVNLVIYGYMFCFVTVIFASLAMLKWIGMSVPIYLYYLSLVTPFCVLVAIVIGIPLDCLTYENVFESIYEKFRKPIPLKKECSNSKIV